MKEALRVCSEEYSQKLDDDEYIDEIAILLVLQVFFFHEVHELSDEFWHQ